MREFLIRLANAENIEEYYAAHREEFISLAEKINDGSINRREITDLISQLSFEIEFNNDFKERISMDLLSALIKANPSEIVQDTLMQMADDLLPVGDIRKEKIARSLIQEFTDSDDERKARALDYICEYVISNIEDDKLKSDLVDEAKVLKTEKTISDDSLYSLLSEYEDGSEAYRAALSLLDKPFLALSALDMFPETLDSETFYFAQFFEPYEIEFKEIMDRYNVENEEDRKGLKAFYESHGITDEKLTNIGKQIAGSRSSIRAELEFDYLQDYIMPYIANKSKIEIVNEYQNTLDMSDEKMPQRATLFKNQILEYLDLETKCEAIKIVTKGINRVEGVMGTYLSIFDMHSEELQTEPNKLVYENAMDEVLGNMLKEAKESVINPMDMSDPFNSFFERGYRLSNSREKLVDVVEKILTTEMRNMLLESSINRSVENFAIEYFTEEEKRRIVEDLLKAKEEGKLDKSKTSVVPVADVITTLAASIKDEEYTKDTILRTQKLFPKVPIFGFIKALKEVQDEEFSLGFLEEHGSIDEIRKNYPKLVRSKEKLDRFLTIAKTEQEKIAIIMSVEEESLLDEYLPEFEFTKIAEDLKDPEPVYIGLPKDLFFGVEFEAEGYDEKESENLFKRIDTSDWEIKHEGTLTHGTEVTSVEHFSDGKGLAKALKMADIMTSMGFEEFDTCGGHIHFGFDYFESDGTDGNASLKNLIRIWKEAEEIIYKISNQKGEPSREGIVGNAMAIDASIYDVDNIDAPESFRNILEAAKDEKHFGLNLSNLKSEDKNTIEFRVSNGTIDRETLKNNIRLYGTMMFVSKDMVLHPEKYKEKFNAYRDRTLSERDKLEALLDLLFEDNQVKQIYRERWDSVKDEEIYDTVSMGDTTFKRGDYTLSLYAKSCVSTVKTTDIQKYRDYMQKKMQRRIDEDKGIRDGTTDSVFE